MCGRSPTFRRANDSSGLCPNSKARQKGIARTQKGFDGRSETFRTSDGIAAKRAPTEVAKTLRIEIVVEEDDGRRIVKTLEGEAAEKWSAFVEQVCMMAFTHNANPDWESLNWQKRELASDED
jgi:hypothetical protein